MVKFRVVELFLLSILSDIAYRVHSFIAQNSSPTNHLAMKIIQLLLVILQQKYRKVLQVQKDLMWKGRMFHFPILKQPAC